MLINFILLKNRYFLSINSIFTNCFLTKWKCRLIVSKAIVFSFGQSSFLEVQRTVILWVHYFSTKIFIWSREAGLYHKIQLNCIHAWWTQKSQIGIFNLIKIKHKTSVQFPIFYIFCRYVDYIFWFEFTRSLLNFYFYLTWLKWKYFYIYIDKQKRKIFDIKYTYACNNDNVFKTL